MKDFFFPHPHIPGVKADVLGTVLNWPISNTVTFMIFMTVLFLGLAFWMRSFKEVPGFFQSMFELFIDGVENLLHSLTSGKNHRVKELLFPIFAIFLIIGAVNIIGSFPILGEFTWSENGHLIPLFRKATSDINVTLPLAFVVVLSMQAFGVKNWGFFGYFKRFIPLDKLVHGAKTSVSEFMLAIVELFVGLLELLSEFIKVISLSLRLFGNMFAGEILLAILMGIFAIALPAVWIGFDLLVAVIQTLVFGCLIAVYYTLVVKEDGEVSH